MKRTVVIIISIIMLLGVSGCTAFPEYHSEDTIQTVTEELFGEAVTLLTMEEDKENKRIIYTYEDGKGREFRVFSYAEHSNFDGADLPGYYSKITESYQKDIFMLHKEEFDAIVEKHTKDTGITLDYISCDTESKITDWQVEIMPIYIRFTSDATTKEQVEEDIRVMAEMGMEADALLDFEYDWEKARFREDDVICDWYPNLCRMQLVFEVANDKMKDRTQFDFSVSEEERWTEEELYTYLIEQLDEETLAK